MNTTFLLIGIIGMLIILVAFIQEQRGILKRTDTAYDLINFIGSALLVAYAWHGHAWPFLILNSVWALYSLKDLILKR